MKCKKFFAAAAACLMVAGFAACGNEPTPVSPDEKVFQIGICQLVEHPALDEATRGFQEFLPAEDFALDVRVLAHHRADRVADARRLIEDYYFGVAHEPFADDYLLLVAAREILYLAFY